jgi:hypothetical protein
LPFVSLRAYTKIQTSSVSASTIVSEWQRRNSADRWWNCFVGRRLSRDPISKKYFVAMMKTKVPVQSATALPKNDPQCVDGSARL